MLIRDEILLRIKLCPGIGLRGEQLTLAWLQTAESATFSNWDLVLEHIIKILQAARLKSERFQTAFFATKTIKEWEEQRLQGWISILSPKYPAQLREIYQPPIILFYQGKLDLLKKAPCLGIVGARNCSNYAVAAMKKTLDQRVTSQYVIVSGLAAGVDTLGHQLALAFRGQTIAVLGTGLNRFYPAANQSLQQQLASNQLVISEYGRGQGPLPFHFVERNRIIAGLCQKLLVVEARQKSGSLITASLALQNGRDVLAIPGAITNHASVGCNELIAAGAQPCLTTADLLGRVVI
ncbi:DNA-processing protein DprA [Fructilactobacillus florum]|uniref:DNA processing protein n=1 Tax=Fructilactobacillus florum DSM 22689 = JCM 16035 TaxID=1423745 RepID=A0A0R2CK05_9LACO|nr:DNA-processing protein DprA [Fructilactobacillus florum]KRM91458.1 DNA processing protein [Fructilactobacillus florum DSM 22689 = JCM 16035]